MSRRPSAFHLHWPALLVLAVLGGTGYLALTLPQGSLLRPTVIALWGLVPATIAVGQYAYSRFERYRMVINRIWLALANPASSWGMTAELDVEDVDQAWRAADKALDELVSKGDRKLSSIEGNAVWSIKGLTLQLAVVSGGDPIDGDRQFLRVELPPLTRPFRAWRRTIEDVAVQLVSRIEGVVRPLEAKYAVRILFPGASPYFGLFVSQVKRASVARFNIELKEDVAGKGERVRVFEDKVEIVAGTLAVAQVLSLRYLTLTATPGTR